MIMFSSQLLIFIIVALASALPRVASAQEPASEKPSEPISDEIDNDVSNESGVINERLFVQYFVKRRKEHLDVVKNMRHMKSYEQRYKMVTIVAENSLKIIETSRLTIEGIKFVPGDSEALKNLTIRHALSTILENCALFGDVILQLPDITPRVLKSQKSWNETLHWGLRFVNETRHLLDKSTIAMFDLVHQELKITPRQPNFANPYWPKNNDDTTSQRDGGKKKKIAKEKKKNKGPRMVNIEL